MLTKLAKLKQNTAKLYKLLVAGEYSKIANALKLRADRLIRGKNSTKRTDMELHERELSRVLRKYFDCDNTYQPGTTKIALILRGGSMMPQSSTFIRLVAPLTHPSVHDEISLKLYPENTADIDEATDICIVQRTAFDNTLAAKKLVKKLRHSGIKLVLDTDDAFSMLENSHSQYREQAGRIKGLKRILEHADQLWVSTPILAGVYGNRDNHFVVRNTLDGRLWQRQKNGAKQHMLVNSKRPLQLVCMGTATHDDDLEMIMPALEEVAEKYPGSFELTLIGVTDGMVGKPWLKRVRQPKFGAMYPNFVQWFLKQGPFDAGLSPLRDIEFNRSKSDIKCLDYLAAGIVPLVSDVTPYQSEDLDSYITKVANEHDEWVRQLTEWVTDAREFRRQKKETIRHAQRHIWQNRSSQQTAEKLRENISSLLESK